jgi:hypothetical protein
MALGSIEPLTEMSTRNLPEGKGLPAREAHNLTSSVSQFVYKIWEPQRLTNQWDYTACYKDNFTFCLYMLGS